MLCVYYSCIYQDVCIYSPVPFLVEWAWEDLSICYHARTQCSWSLLLWTFFEQESFAVHLYVNSFLTLVLCVFRKQSFVLGRCICVALLHTMLLCHVSCLPFFLLHSVSWALYAWCYRGNARLWNRALFIHLLFYNLPMLFTCLIPVE